MGGPRRAHRTQNYVISTHRSLSTHPSIHDTVSLLALQTDGGLHAAVVLRCLLAPPLPPLCNTTHRTAAFREPRIILSFAPSSVAFTLLSTHPPHSLPLLALLNTPPPFLGRGLHLQIKEDRCRMHTRNETHTHRLHCAANRAGSLFGAAVLPFGNPAILFKGKVGHMCC
jgi:hypothetical protein